MRFVEITTRNMKYISDDISVEIYKYIVYFGRDFGFIKIRNFDRDFGFIKSEISVETEVIIHATHTNYLPIAHKLLVSTLKITTHINYLPIAHKLPVSTFKITTHINYLLIAHKLPVPTFKITTHINYLLSAHKLPVFNLQNYHSYKLPTNCS